MITAEELRDARNRAGYTSQAALAKALGVAERTVTNWEAEGGHVSARAEAKVRALLWPAPGPLSSYSDYELLSEIGRRLDWARRQGGNPGGVQESSGTGDESSQEGADLPRKGPEVGWGSLL